MKVRVRAYASPGCVLLAFDWPDGGQYEDFLGFAIQRTPGYGSGKASDWLTNKLDFLPLAPDAKPKPSNQAPFQKFRWWDGGIDDDDRGRTFRYRVIPVRGSGPDDLSLVKAAAGAVSVTIPQHREGAIATYFNRAVVSSQSFARLVQRGTSLEQQMDWLAGGIEQAFPATLDGADAFQCAIYHLTDRRWILPALRDFAGTGKILYHEDNKDQDSRNALAAVPLGAHIDARPRFKGSLMHNKFLVRQVNGRSEAVLMGSANFTPEGLTTQANLFHIIHSPQLAAAYAERADALLQDPEKRELTAKAHWQEIDDVPGTAIRLIFAPEAKERREALDTLIQAVNQARSSVLFCAYSPTDADLLQAILAAGDNGKILHGMLNTIPKPKEGAAEIAVRLYHRSRKDKKVLKYGYFGKDDAPRGFLPELYTLDVSRYAAGKAPDERPWTVQIHHKFILIDGDTDRPTLYTGSANFSRNSTYNNDENLLEIKGNQRLAEVYVAEFMRLYEHFRARAIWDMAHPQGSENDFQAEAHTPAYPLVLKRRRADWDKKAYVEGTPAFLSRTHLL